MLWLHSWIFLLNYVSYVWLYFLCASYWLLVCKCCVQWTGKLFYIILLTYPLSQNSEGECTFCIVCQLSVAPVCAMVSPHFIAAHLKENAQISLTFCIYNIYLMKLQVFEIRYETSNFIRVMTLFQLTLN